jgi:hypothetical protein
VGDPPRVLRSGPTLRTWIYTLAVGLMTFAGAAVASHAVEKVWSYREAETRASEIQIIESIPPVGQRKMPAVIIFGTSRIEAVTLRAGLEHQFPNVQLIVLIGAFGSRAPIEDLVPVMQKAHPDLVLIEIGSMRRADADPPLMRRMRHLQLAAAIALGVAGRNPSTDATSLPPSCDGLVLRKSAEVGNVADDYRRWFRHPQLDRLPVLLELQAAGIQVGVLDMPRAAELEAAAPNLVTFRTTMGAALAGRGVAMWSAPGIWPADLFCDLSHLNHDGALLFDKWLSERLRQALNLPQ